MNKNYKATNILVALFVIIKKINYGTKVKKNKRY